MNIIVKQKRGNIVQTTTLDERWYGEFNAKGKYVGYRPSLTWIASYYPKGKEYERYIGSHGYDESQELRKEAGERGSRVHRAVEELLKRYIAGDKKKVKMIDLFMDLEGEKKDLNPDEWHCVMTFVDWFKTKKIKKVLASEETFLTALYGFTLDVRYIYEKKGNDINTITDFKTSKYIYPSSEIQITGQKRGCEENNLRVDEISILQLGYPFNKRGWKETVFPYQPELLDATYTIWKKENEHKKPHQRDYPLELTLKLNLGGEK